MNLLALLRDSVLKSYLDGLDSSTVIIEEEFELIFFNLVLGISKLVEVLSHFTVDGVKKHE